MYNILSFVYASAFANAGTLYTDVNGMTEAASWADAETTYYTRTGVKTTKNDENKVTASQVAFRPYFEAAPSGARGQRSIIFGGAKAEEFKDGPESFIDGGIEIYVKGHEIVTTSHLKEATTIRIVNVSGVTLANYVLQPGETVETPIHNAGVYIVNRKKVAIR